MNPLRIALVACCLALSHASAQSVSSDHVTAEWMSETTHVQPGTPFWLGLKLTHAEHWHTYWTNPGESGFATTVEWSLPEGFSADPIQWPFPKWSLAMGQVTFGYDGTVMALVRITPPANLEVGSSVKLGGEVSWLECEDVCIPGGGEASLSLPVKNEPPAVDAQSVTPFKEARAKLPFIGTGWSATAEAGSTTLSIRVRPPEGFSTDVGAVRFFPDQESLFDYADGLPVRQEDGEFVVEGKLNPANEGLPERVSGLWVAEKGLNAKGQKAVHLVATFGADTAASVPAAAVEKRGLPMVLLFAFLGGIILNAMPCVFPVISLKILGFVNLAGSDPTPKSDLRWSVARSAPRMPGAPPCRRSAGRTPGAPVPYA